MRPSSLAFAVACAVALPSGAALFGFGPAVCLPLIGVGLGVGLGIMAGLDLWDYLRHSSVDVRLDEGRAWAAELSNQERELRLSAPVAAAEIQPATPPDTSAAWLASGEKFLFGGDERGFSARKLAGVVGSDGWPVMKSWLETVGILANYGQGRGYAYADGMTLAKALTRLRSGVPCPEGHPPDVNWAYNDSTLRSGSQRAATVVIDGTRSD